MLFFGRLFLVSFFLFLRLADSGFAMTVTPTEIEMRSTGRLSRSVITVVNSSALPLPVELVVKKANLDERGQPTTEPIASDDLLIMPPQALIPPGATQNFRLQWLGEPLLGKSESFFIYVNQIPVKFKRHGPGVQVVFSMGVMLNVAPPNAQPALKVVSAEVVIDKLGRRRAIVTVENPANVHSLLPEWTVHLSSGSWSETLSPGVLDQFIGIGLVQPGHRRRFLLPVIVPDEVASLQCSLEFGAKR